MRLIKRYKNRRLYDTRSSRTITQADLGELIRDGEAVKVVDSATGSDVTLAVLGQVLVTESSSWNDLQQARELITNIIFLGGDKSMSILKNTILASIGMISVTKAKAEKIIDDLIKKGELDKSKRKKAIMELLDKADKSTEDFRKKVLREAEKTGKSISKYTKDLSWARQSDVKKLDAKVNKLAKAIKDLEAKLDSGTTS